MCTHFNNYARYIDYVPGVIGFAYHYKDQIVKTLEIALPVLGAVSCLYSAAQSQTQEMKNTFVKKPEESVYSYMERIACPVSKTVAVGIAALVPQALVPSEFSWIGSSIAATGTLLIVNEGPKILKQACKFFSLQGDSLRDLALAYTKRGLAVAGLGLIGLGAMECSVLIPEILDKSSEYEIWLPWQTTPVVFGEYALLSLAHLAFSYGHFMQKNRMLGIYHSLNSLASIAFPSYYLHSQGHNGELRIHHSWLGQALQILPFAGTRALGSVFSLDSLNYAFNVPGYDTYRRDILGNHCDVERSIYGFDNVFAENYLPILQALCVAIFLEQVGKAIKSSTQKPAETQPLLPEENTAEAAI